MLDRSESVNVHRGDARQVVREFREKGYVLKERNKSTIAAQVGFVQLVFVPEEDMPQQVEAAQPQSQKRKRLFFWRQHA